MKRFCITLLLPLIVSTAWGAYTTVDGIKYWIDGTNISDWRAIVWSTTLTSNEITIPQYVGYRDANVPVISIGANVFKGMSNLTIVNIPSSVKQINNSAFYECTSLVSINTINVTSIGDEAFYGCTGLTDLIIPDKMTNIGESAFKNCSNLKRIVVWDNPTSLTIGTDAFDGLSPDLSVSVKELSVWDNISGSFPQGAFLFVNGKPFDHLTIPNDVTDIPSGAYKGMKFKTVIIGSNVKTMGANCFTPGSIKKTIWLPNVVPSGSPSCAKGMINYCSSSAYSGSLFSSTATDLIKYPSLTSRFTVDGVVYALAENNTTTDVIDCDYDAATTSVSIGPTVTYKGRTFPVRHIRDYACYGNDSIIGTVNIANNGDIGKYAFYNSDNIQTLAAANQGKIDSYAFYDCDNIQTLTVTNQGYIGSYAFADCDNIATLTATNQGVIGEYAFANSRITNTAIVKNIGDIKFMAFKGVTGSYAADIDNVGSIASDAFSSNKISILSVGNNVTSIGERAFRGSTISTSATLTNNGDIAPNAFQNVNGSFVADINNVGSLGDYSFAGSSMSTVTIHPTVSNVGLSAFRESTITTKANIRHTGTTGRAAFRGTKGGFEADIQCSGILPDSCFYESVMSTVTIGDAVTSIEYNCFESSSFGQATIGSGVTSIKDRGFALAKRFTRMVLPDNVCTMGVQAFKGCSTMKNITLSRGLSRINEGTFSGCTALASIFLPQQIDSISNNVFYNCQAMRTVVFEEKEGDYRLGYTTSPKGGLFTTAYSLDSVYVGGRLKYRTSEDACYSPFYHGATIRAVRFTDNEIRIYNREFAGCAKLENIYMGSGIESVGDSAFMECVALQHVKLGTGVKSLGQHSFHGCQAVTDIDLSNVVTIHDNSFQNCYSLPVIRLPQSTTRVGNLTFLNCKALKTLIIENRTDTLFLGYNYNNTSYKGITGAGTPLFSSCPLDSVYIGGPIKYSQTKKDGYSPFFYNESLRTVYVANNEKQVYENEFYDCLNLTTIRLGEGVERIEKFGFQSCTGLLYFTFGSTLQNIGANAFSDCSNVAVITSHAVMPPVCGEQALGDINFWDCKLFVPAGSVEAYQTADQWSLFWAEPLDEPEPSTPGDINGDSDVDVADIVAIIDKVLEGSADAAYDVNNDGSVDVADIVAVIDYVLSYAGAPSQAPARRAKPAAPIVLESSLTAEADLDGIALGLNSDVEYTAFQFLLTLPDGAKLTDIVADAERLDGHTLRFRQLDENSYFVLGYASDNHEIYGTQGTLLRMVTEDFASGMATVSDIRFVTSYGESHRLQALNINAATGIATGINEMANGQSWNSEWYDLSGRPVSAHRKLSAGIYLRNGKKMAIK